MSDRYIIPRRLDDPELIGFWTVDEFAGMPDELQAATQIQQKIEAYYANTRP